jgi:methionyl-tRNA formyltransferase
MSKILVVTDNEILYESIKEEFEGISNGDNLDVVTTSLPSLEKIDLKDAHTVDRLIGIYDLVISLHCQQLFPKKLHESVRCVNIHPGYNPYNRGWYPQAFSIINKLPAGVTIHEINDNIDDGDIIVQKQIKLEETDTSFEGYNKILELEKQMIKEYLPLIISGKYKTSKPTEKGNLNFKEDYYNLCKLDLKNIATFEHHINILKALSHGEYKNAYYVNELGEKIFIKIEVSKENK